MVNPPNPVEVLYKKSVPTVRLGSVAHGVHNRKHEKKKADNSVNNSRFRSRKPPKNPRALAVSKNPAKLTDVQKSKVVSSHQRKNSPQSTKQSPISKSEEQKYYLPRIKSEKRVNHTPRLLSRSKFVLSSKQAGSNSSLVVNISRKRIRSAQERKQSPTTLRNDRLKQFFFKSGDTRQIYYLSSTLKEKPPDKEKGFKAKAVKETGNTEKDAKVRNQKQRSKSMDNKKWGGSTSVLDNPSDIRGRNKDSQTRNVEVANRNGRKRSGKSLDKRRISYIEEDESDIYYESNRCFGDRNPDIYRHVLGPTPDETILAGLQTVIEMCSVAETSLATRPLSSSNLFSSNQDVIDWVESEYSSLENDQKSTHSQGSLENLKHRRQNLQEIERLVKIKSQLDEMARDMKTQEELKSVYTKESRRYSGEMKDDEKLQYQSASGTSTRYTPSTSSTDKRYDLAVASTTQKVQQPSSTTFGQMSTTWNSSARSVEREPTYGDIQTPTEFSSRKNTPTEISDPLSKSMQAAESTIYSTKSLQTSLDDYPSSRSTKSLETSTKSIQTSLEPLLSGRSMQTSICNYPSSITTQTITSTKSAQTSLEPLLSHIAIQTSDDDYPSSKSIAITGRSLETTNKSLQTSLDPLLSNRSMQTSIGLLDLTNRSVQTFPATTSGSLRGPIIVENSERSLQVEPSRRESYKSIQTQTSPLLLVSQASKNIQTSDLELSYGQCYNCGCDVYQATALYDGSTRTPTPSYKVISQRSFGDRLHPLESIQEEASSIASSQNAPKPVTSEEQALPHMIVLKEPTGEEDLHSLSYVISVTESGPKITKAYIKTSEDFEQIGRKSAIRQSDDEQKSEDVLAKKSILADSDEETGDTTKQGQVDLPESHESTIKSAMRFPHQMSSLYESETTDAVKFTSRTFKSPQKGSAYETLQKESVSQPNTPDEEHNLYGKSDIRRTKTSQEFNETKPSQKSQLRDSLGKSPSRLPRKAVSIQEVSLDNTEGAPGKETSRPFKKSDSVQESEAERMQTERVYLEEPPARSPSKFSKRMITAPQESNIDEIEQERAYLEDADGLEQERAYSRRMPSGQDMDADIIPQERVFFEDPSFRSPSRISRRMPPVQESEMNRIEQERTYLEEPSFRSPSRLSRRMPSAQESNMSRIEKERAYLEEPSFRSPSRISRRMSPARKSEIDRIERERSYYEERSPSRVSRRMLPDQEPEMERMEKERSYFEDPSNRSPSRYLRRMPTTQELEADRIEQERAYLEETSYRSPSRMSRRMPSTQDASRMKSERAYFEHPSVRSLPAPTGRMLYVQDQDRVESEITLVDNHEVTTPTRSSRRVIAEDPTVRSPTRSSRRMISAQDVGFDRARKAEEYLDESTLRSPTRSSRRIISVEEAETNRMDATVDDTAIGSQSRTSRKFQEAESRSPSRSSKKLLPTDADILDNDRFIGEMVVKSSTSSRRIVAPQGSHISRASVRPSARSSRRVASVEELDIDQEENSPSREPSLIKSPTSSMKRVSSMPESDAEKTPEEIIEEAVSRISIRTSRKFPEHESARIEKSAVSFKEPRIKSSMKSVTIQPGQKASMSQLYASPEDSTLSIQDHAFHESKQSKIAQELSDAKLLEKSFSRKKTFMQDVDKEPSREESRRFHRVSAKASSLQPIQEKPLSETPTEEIVMDESLGVSTLDSITESSQRSKTTSDERQQSQEEYLTVSPSKRSVKNESQREIPPAEPYLSRRGTDESKSGSIPSYPSLKVIGSKTSRHRSVRKDLSRDKVRRKSSHRITRHPNKCSCGNPNCECFKSIQPREIRYATVRITKFDFYSTFEILSSTKKKPKFIPSSIESIFVVKNK